jgi:hypothetical protein
MLHYFGQTFEHRGKNSLQASLIQSARKAMEMGGHINKAMLIVTTL